MAEENLQYKVVLDTSEIPSALEQIKSQINNTLAGTMQAQQAMMPTQMPMAAPMDMAPMVPPPAEYMAVQGQADAAGGFSSWAQNTADSMKMGYYKMNEVASAANLMRKSAGMQISNYFDIQKNEIADMDPVQLMMAKHFGEYNPYTSFKSRGEIQHDIDQRLADNSTFGMMDYSFGEFVGAGAGAGLSIGGFGGVKGALIGAGVGAVAGAGAWATNEIMKPFASEALFKRNITRGLKEYSKYSVMGRTGFDEREDVAEMVANIDLDPELLGSQTGRDEVKAMFDIGMGTNYMNTSSNMGELKDKLQKFMKSYTKIQHIIGKTGEELGQYVDAMNDAGLLDQFGGDMIGGANYIRGAGMAARLTSDQAMQVFTSGAEMVRGTGIETGAGGTLLLNNLADTVNMLKYNQLTDEDMRQLGGTQNAAAVLTKNAFDTAVSPMGQALGFSLMNGTYDPAMNSSEAYISGVSGIGGYGDYVKKMTQYNQYLSDGGSDTVQMADMASKVTLLKDAGLITDGMSQDEIAFVVSNQSKSLFGRQMTLPEAKLMLANATRSKESILAPLDEEIRSIQQTTIGETYSGFSRFTAGVGQIFTEIGRGLGGLIDPGSTEITPSWVSNNYGITTTSDIRAYDDETTNEFSDVYSDSSKLKKQYSNLNDDEAKEYENIASVVNNEDDVREFKETYKNNANAIKYLNMVIVNKGIGANLLVDSENRKRGKYALRDTMASHQFNKWEDIFGSNRENSVFKRKVTNISSRGDIAVHESLERERQKDAAELISSLGYQSSLNTNDMDEQYLIYSALDNSTDVDSGIGALSSALQIFSDSDFKDNADSLNTEEIKRVHEISNVEKNKLSKMSPNDAVLYLKKNYPTNLSDSAIKAILYKQYGDKAGAGSFEKIGIKEQYNTIAKEFAYGSKGDPDMYKFGNLAATFYTQQGGLAGAIGSFLGSFFNDNISVDGDRDFDSVDLDAIAKMSKKEVEAYEKEKGITPGHFSSRLPEIREKYRAGAVAKNFSELRDEYSSGLSQIESGANSANLTEEEKAEYDIWKKRWSASNNEVIDISQARESLKTQSWAKKITLDNKNIFTWSDGELDAEVFRSSGHSLEVDRLKGRAEHLYKQADIATELRTTINPDGSISQGRDMEGMQATSTQALSTIAKTTANQLMVQRASLLVMASKGGFTNKGENVQQEVDNALSFGAV